MFVYGEPDPNIRCGPTRPLTTSQLILPTPSIAHHITEALKVERATGQLRDAA